jgi:hypothetical protein
MIPRPFPPGCVGPSSIAGRGTLPVLPEEKSFGFIWHIIDWEWHCLARERFCGHWRLRLKCCFI